VVELEQKAAGERAPRTWSSDDGLDVGDISLVADELDVLRWRLREVLCT